MRWTVISSDLMLFFPSAFWFVWVYCKGKAEGSAPWLLVMVLLNPCAILIDHGHFQVGFWILGGILSCCVGCDCCWCFN